MNKSIKRKLKQSVVGTLILYFTLTALGLSGFSLLSLFVISSVVVFIGLKKFKPLAIGAGVFLLLMIASSSEVVATLVALFNLAVGVGVAVIGAMWMLKNKKMLSKKFLSIK